MTTATTASPRKDVGRLSLTKTDAVPPTVSPHGRAARLVAVLAALGFATLAAFQAALAAGAPWGHAAWGGENAHLPTAQQTASGVAALIYVAAPLIVLTRAGIIWRARNSVGLFRWGTWFLAAAMALGAVPNFVSQSRWENFVLGPLAICLAALCIVVARGNDASTRPRRKEIGA